jgi:hypothetical protein
MRARIRHFSYKAAGANLALDARYITGVSNATTFSPWSDISGNANNASQATTARRGTYYVRDSNFGGQAAVDFDLNGQMAWTPVSSKSTFIVMYRASARYSDFGVALDNGGLGAASGGVHSNASYDYTYNWTPAIQRVNRVAVTDNTSKWWTSGGVGYFEDSSGFSLKQIGFESGGLHGPKAFISHISLFTTALGSSFVRRIEDHLGFSFKLKN